MSMTRVMFNHCGDPLELRKLTWLQNYVHIITSASSFPFDVPSCSSSYVPYPLFDSATFTNYPHDYVVLLANVLTIQEPSTYLKASKHKEWVDAV